MTAPVDLVKRLSPESPTVFLFHGVSRRRTVGVRNYTGKHVDAQEFVGILDALQQVGSSCSIAEVAEFVNGDCALPSNSFSLTFDDGFWNNLTVAAPILHGRGIHGAFYVVSGFMDGSSLTWVDRIESAVAATSRASFRAPSPVGGEFSLNTTDERIHLMRCIRTAAKSSPSTDLEAFADEICHGLGVPEPITIEELDRKLTAEDVRALGADEMFTIGSHSATHPILSRLTGHRLVREIDGSLDELEVVLGKRIDTFAYPEGFAGSYGPEALRLLQQRGVASAVTTIPGSNVKGTARLEIHRVFVA